jgi:hypothetical protein
MAEEEPAEFERCAELEDHLRHGADHAFSGEVFLHRSGKPLREVIVGLKRQGALDVDMFSDECSGVCGV